VTDRRFPPPWSAEVTPNLLHCVPVAKGRLPAAFGLLNLHTNCPGYIRVGDLIPLRNPETSPSTNLLGLFSLSASDEGRHSVAQQR
jgi:hypothetical protein